MNAAETARSSVAFRVVTACVSVAILTGCIPDDARSTTASGSESSGVVERVVDGDTIEVRLATGGEPIRVRILGIDTPETVNPDTDVQCWGPEASVWARQQLDHRAVTLISDPVADATDRYGRALRYVVLPDGSNYSIVAAGAGMARAYTYKGQQLSEAANIVAAQSTAQDGGAGLWGPPCHGRTVPN